MVALEFDDELASVLAAAPQVESHALVEQSEPGNLRGLVSDVLHLPVRREDYI